jgi:hypothetical protein
VRNRYVHSLVFLLLAVNAFSQTYGNEWINYSQKYFKIPVVKEGIYHIDSLSLARVGINLSAVNPRNFQLFARGKEQYIYIKGEADGVFNAKDTLEFYGQKNDGFLDTALYAAGVANPNPYISLFNDTAYYYLTWNNSSSNLRMLALSDTVTSFAVQATFVWKEDVYSVMSDYYQGTTDGLNITDPEYLPMESIVCPSISYGQSFSAPLNTPNACSGGPAALMKLRVLTRTNDFGLNPDYHIQIQYPGGQFDTLVDGYMTFLLKKPISASVLSASSPVTLFSINPGTSISGGDAAFSFVSIKYPHTLDMEGKTELKLFVPGHASPAKSQLHLTNFNSGGGALHLYDLTYHRRYTLSPTGNSFNVLISDSLNTEKTCYLTSDNSLNQVLAIVPVNGNGVFTNFKLQVADSAFVLVTHSKLMNAAQSYKLYRSSVQGGSNHVILADVNELYDQFSFGISMHPLSIRNFCAYLIKYSPTKPKYLFLMGKSINAVDGRFGAPGLLPTMGYPSSDNLFTARLGNSSYAPVLATGRLAARSNADVLLYLNKVSAYEQNAPAAWMKQVIHFGGGDAAGEQALFKSYLGSYKNIIEADTNYGGHVISFFKTSTAPIQINLSDSLKQLIDNGVSLMTFFGHAAGDGFDQSIDDPSNYNNAPRFPLILANSCYAGDIHSNSPIRTSSERFILNSHGAIGFIASTYLGLSGELNPYAAGFYKSLSKYNYGRSVGRHIQYTIHQREMPSGLSLYGKLTVLTMTLHGDPSIVICSPRLPDYEISDPDLSFDTHSNPDSVTVIAVMHNFGKSVIDSFFVKIQRKFPNGDTIVYRKLVKAPVYKDTLKYKMVIDFNRGLGLNKISVTLDFTNRIKEMNENNNSTGDVNLLLQGSAVNPVWPYNDAIIPYDTVTLKASTANPFEPARTYRFQIDTTDQYNSPFMRSGTLVNKPGGVISWTPTLLTKDSLVYYWRVSPDSTSPTNAFRWKECSFQYITGKHGWEQAHFFQFKNDGYQFVKLNRPQRKFDFVNDVKSIEINNGIMNFTTINWPDVNYKINGTALDQSSCTIPAVGMSFALLDPVSLNPVSVIDTLCTPNIVVPYQGKAGNTVCACNTVLNAFDFCDTSAALRTQMEAYLHAAPVGSYLIAWNNDGFNNNQYSASLINEFKSFGSNQIQSAPSGMAYILFGKKGWTPGQAKEVVATNINQKIQVLDTVTTNWNSGFVASEVIGPALSWGSLHWRQTHLESPSTDSTVIRVIGITPAGSQVVLANFPKDSIDVYDLGQYVNPKLYPYIRLIAFMSDNIHRTPAQLKRWQVIYAPAPEMAVNPAINFSLTSATVQEGQPLKMTCAIQNISDFNFTDTLQISYWLLDRNQVKHNLSLANNKSFRLRKPPFNAGSYFIDTVIVNTTGYPGLNSVWMEANPIGAVHSQYEQYHFNNLIQKSFSVTTDKINPLLDVTFDGVHILDGDIVSAKPNVLISLKDENMYLALNDPANFKVFIQYPHSTVLQPVSFGNDLVFTPAVLPKNSCKLNYTPVLSADGVYTLVVQAKDRSNNTSSVLNYQANFEVINHAMITDVMNYPNPFTTATHFVFTVTGSEVPSMFRIQIMTITGKLVREIERDELGPLHIGRNITEYAWDGRDQFGDRLANGVYFYRVLTKINTENIEHMDSGADTYFKKGFGKMYLMR